MSQSQTNNQPKDLIIPHPPLILAVLLCLLFLPPVRAADWKPAAGPLMTRWAKDVSPANALPENPPAADGAQGLAEPERSIAATTLLGDEPTPSARKPDTSRVVRPEDLGRDFITNAKFGIFVHYTVACAQLSPGRPEPAIWDLDAKRQVSK